MEQYPPAINSESTNQNPDGLHRLVSWKVGLLEFSLGIIVLLLVFVVLNYFNILSISNAFPNQLGWLPQREVPVNTSQKPTSSIIPTPTGFQYDVAKAKSRLATYITSSLNQGLLPVSPIVSQGQQIGGTKSNLPYEFGWFYTSPTGATFSANLHYVKNSNTLNDQEIFIQLSDKIVPQTSTTADLTNSLIDKYFSNLKVRSVILSDCSNTKNSSYCQVFNIDTDGKRGYGMLISITQSNSLFKTLFSCFVPKESPDYSKTESCITPQ